MTAHNLITPEEVSSALGISINTLKNWRCQKEHFWRHVKISNRVMYVQDELDNYLQEVFDAR